MSHRRIQSLLAVAQSGSWDFTPSNRSLGDQEVVRTVMVYPSIFLTAGIPLVAGREFNESDLSENSPAVCVVNETFARHVFGNENPIGQSCVAAHRPRADDISQPRYGSPQVPYRIVGVVRDSRLMNPTGSIPPIIFTPFLQLGTGRGQMVLYVRVVGNASVIIPEIRAAVLQVDPTLPQFEVHTLAQEMEEALARERLIAMLSTCFSVLALVLACIGVYGLLAFAVAQRTGEIGIRMALGAARSDMLWMILREAMGLGLLV